MEYNRLVEIIQDYVSNDFEAAAETAYIRDALEAVATKEEIEELGFHWVYPEQSAFYKAVNQRLSHFDKNVG